MTRLAREVEGPEIRYVCTVAALHIPGIDNAVVDASSRSSIRATRGDPCPVWELRPNFRVRGVDHCGAMAVNMISGDEEASA